MMIKKSFDMESIQTHRYLITIEFYKSSKPFGQHVKTLKEAMTYKEMIDDTVSKAIVLDRLTGKIVDKWK